MRRRLIIAVLVGSLAAASSVGVALGAELQAKTARASVGDWTRVVSFNHDHDQPSCTVTGWYDVTYYINYRYEAGSNQIRIDWIDVKYQVHSHGILHDRVQVFGLNRHDTLWEHGGREVLAGQTVTLHFNPPDRMYTFNSSAGSMSVIGQAIHSLTFDTGCTTQDYVNFTKP
jgi:hypothetical protein